MIIPPNVKHTKTEMTIPKIPRVKKRRVLPKPSPSPKRASTTATTIVIMSNVCIFFLLFPLPKP